jgi:ABC-type transport system involved in multi-copper enzyme maturation permease subunit
MMEAASATKTKPARSAPGYLTSLRTSFALTSLLILRRRRTILAGLLTLFPVLIPLAVVFLLEETATFTGAKLFERLIEYLYIGILTPLLALFFGATLLSEDIEGETIPYLLSRPIHRSALLLGRFLSYIAISTALILPAVALTFAGCVAAGGLEVTADNLRTVGHYCLVLLPELAAYGAFAIFMGAQTKRPVIYGAIFVFGWQWVAVQVPGLVDFLTIQKYVTSLLPYMPFQKLIPGTIPVQADAVRDVYAVSAGFALVALAIITLIFLIATVVVLRIKQYSTGKVLSAG